MRLVQPDRDLSVGPMSHPEGCWEDRRDGSAFIPKEEVRHEEGGSDIHRRQQAEVVVMAECQHYWPSSGLEIDASLLKSRP